MFLVLGRTERDMIKMSSSIHVKYQVGFPIFMKIEFSRHFFEKKYSNIRFLEIRPVGADTSMRTDGWTDKTKLTVALRNFANAPKNQ